MLWPPPGQMMTAQPFRLSAADSNTVICGVLTFVSLMILRSPTGLSVGLLTSCSGGSSFVSSGALPGHKLIGCGSAASATSGPASKQATPNRASDFIANSSEVGKEEQNGSHHTASQPADST